MRTSLEEIKQIEDHHFGKLQMDDNLVFEARLILEPKLKEKLWWQKEIYKLIQLYSRKKLKSEIEAVHQKLFLEPEHIPFREKIFQLFKK